MLITPLDCTGFPAQAVWLFSCQCAAKVESLVILGTESVYLGYEKSPEFSEPIEQLLLDLWNYIQDKLQQIFNQMAENVKDWWAERWPKIQKSIEDWIQKELSGLLQQLINEVEKLIREACLQPFAFALALAGVFLYRKRRYP